MPGRRVFYSFHYQRDIWRVNQVRHNRITKDNLSDEPIDHASWEQIKRTGDSAVKQWITRQLNGAGVTVVLIGAETYTRPYVLYEIEKSWELRKGLLGIRIHGLGNREGLTDWPGQNPFDHVKISVPFLYGSGFYQESLSSHIRVYDWVNDNGYLNFANWVEAAAQSAGR